MDGTYCVYTREDGSVRFSVDYRKLNVVVISDLYLISRLHKCIDSVGEEKVFSILKPNSGYLKIEIDD